MNLKSRLYVTARMDRKVTKALLDRVIKHELNHFRKSVEED